MRALETSKPDVLITSRVADAALFLAPMVNASSLNLDHTHLRSFQEALLMLHYFFLSHTFEEVTEQITLCRFMSLVGIGKIGSI